jgi:hypothetical protein
MGGQPWPELELHCRPWGARWRGEGGGRGRGWAPWGGGGLQEGGQACRLAATAVRGLFVLAVREKQEEGRREEKRRERKERKEKKSNLEIFKK